ncbi:squalene/phytoene synthase family protein [uncultured Sphingomonas sp.]|uniref:squalene/phytoene synthase family protein n=1 Tax=uncultured Sphingomonas sp. TaxID=158754 RepID=UPI0035CC5600
MVTERLSPDRALAVAYAPAAARPGLLALLALDDALGAVLRRAREPMLARMRYAWWFEALEGLDTAPPPAEPVLRAVAAAVLPCGVTGAALAGMIDGWEAIGDEGPIDDAMLTTFAEARGGTLFDAMARVCGAADAQTRTAGEGWALVDLATAMSDPAVAARARAMAAERLQTATESRWSREGRALGALTLIARFELEGRSPAGRVGRLLMHRLTGR